MPADNNPTFTCSLSGQTVEGSFFDNTDDLGAMPAGWTQITIRRRQYNPRWLAIQAAKEQVLQAVKAQVPEDAWEDQEVLARVQVDASYYAMEKDTPVYELDVTDVVFLSDSDDILDEVNEIRKMLDLSELKPQMTDDAEDVTGEKPES